VQSKGWVLMPGNLECKMFFIQPSGMMKNESTVRSLRFFGFNYQVLNVYLLGVLCIYYQMITFLGL